MTTAPKSTNDEQLEKYFHQMLRIRRAEERIVEIYPSDKIMSPCHLSIGQEAIPVGVYGAADEKDISFATYRSHAAYLACGGTMKQMFAELFGKVTGCMRGKGGSMHLVCPEQGLLGTSAVVASCIPVAVGAAFAFRRRGEPQGVAVYLGDGALEEGIVFESLNYAAKHDLPVFFVCENNYYAIHSRTEIHHAFKKITDVASLFDIPSETVDGMDVLAVAESAERAWKHMREGKGPYFIEYTCYRFMEHVGISVDRGLGGYRSEDEYDAWKARDPILTIGERLSDERRTAVEHAVKQEIDEAVAFAESSPFPEEEELHLHVYK